MFNLKGKKVAILGLGTENLPLLKFLIKQGAEVIVCDKDKKIKKFKGVQEWRLGLGYLKNLTDFEIVFRTPGLPRFTKELVQVEKKRVEISSAMKLFFDLCPSKIIGVTGTKGKGTTVALVYKILSSAISKSKIYQAGNIGTPAISLIGKLKPEDWVVLELSSFQLQDLEKSPHIAIVLNITSDHLDYHKTEKEYAEAKENIVLHQTKKDFAVINADYLTSYKFASQTPGQVFWFSRKKSVDQGCFVKWKTPAHFGEIILRINDQDHLICPTYEINLIGLFNLENICAAACACYLAKANIKDIKKVVTTFRGLEHRLEFVAEIGGVKYINDSFSTTPEVAIAAVESFSKPLVLICGGRSKGGNYNKLAKAVKKGPVKSVITIGEMADELKKKIGIKVKNLKYQSMDKIVQTAQKETKPGDVVLFSPGCASFDMFKNASDRGSQFKQIVKKLKI